MGGVLNMEREKAGKSLEECPPERGFKAFRDVVAYVDILDASQTESRDCRCDLRGREVSAEIT